MKDKNKSKKDIQRENNDLKSKISTEFGGRFGGESDIPPDVENQFLKNVMAFEKQFAERKQTTVYDRIGRPDWIPENKIKDSDMGSALEELYLKLHENNLSIDAICEVEEREMYRFITEELFQETIDDLSIEGMMTCFIYEEFHPNHEHDVKQAVKEFITWTLLKEVDTDDWYFNENLNLQLSPIIDKEKAIRNIKNFINAWSSVKIHEFEIVSVDITDDLQIAHATFEVNYIAIPEGNPDPISFSGKGKMKLENVYKRLECVGWDVLECEFPGFSLLTR
ncbi:hypothetical protein KUV50_11055 [Membranicola marinus]|uniref:Uncharacterized protein n=1 Tax=Membranihabitans marinus TaxID=1227546 RepID=A0A953HUS2_9BACT|nr:hypothetical protein [Membranihabitans marinus]MBY5958675.1 hypothetical protein [Membranihabitans marinus]